MGQKQLQGIAGLGFAGASDDALAPKPSGDGIATGEGGQRTHNLQDRGGATIHTASRRSLQKKFLKNMRLKQISKLLQRI